MKDEGCWASVQPWRREDTDVPTFGLLLLLEWGCLGFLLPGSCLNLGYGAIYIYMLSTRLCILSLKRPTPPF